VADDKILTQTEIDALLSRNAPKARPKPPAANPVMTAKPPEPPSLKAVTPPAPPPKVVPLTSLPRATVPSALPLEDTPPVESIAASGKSYTLDEVASLQETVAELTRHVTKLANAMQRIDILEEKIEQISAVVKLNPESTTIVERRINEIHRALEALHQESLRDGFQCNKCHSRKTVAVYVKCTTCGHENWMGWWPETKPKKLGGSGNP
jgi:hypothetical protein